MFRRPAFFVRGNLPVLSLQCIVRAIAIIGFTARHLFRANRVCFEGLKFDEDDDAITETPFVNFPKKRQTRITDAPSPPSVSTPFVHTPRVSVVSYVDVVVGESNIVRTKDRFPPRRCRASVSISA